MITIDTNIYISAIEYGGKPLDLMREAVRGRVRVAISQPILDEFRRVLSQKFGRPKEYIDEAEARIRSFTHMVRPTVARLRRCQTTRKITGLSSAPWHRVRNAS